MGRSRDIFIGMTINLHADHVIRNLRKPGDTRHYLPEKGFYRYVTSANYFGELVEWTGFALLTASPAAWVFVWWTAANLVPRADAIYKRYCEEFGKQAVGSRKELYLIYIRERRKDGFTFIYSGHFGAADIA